MKLEYPLKLTGPWYRWQLQMVEHGRQPRNSRPVFQKYDIPDAANAFIKDPQRSLQLLDEDCVHVTEGSPFTSSIRRFTERRLLKLSSRLPSGATRCDLRKLFLSVHRRFYLVVCELHCDTSGLPDASHSRVCESGFVIRRRPARTEWEIQERDRLADEIGQTRAQLLALFGNTKKDLLNLPKILLGLPVP